ETLTLIPMPLFRLPITNHQSPITNHRSAGCRRLKPSLLEALLHVAGLKRGDHPVELTLHEEVQIKQSQSDSMISDPVLREIVSPDFFLSAARSDQTPAMGGIFLSLFLLFLFKQPGP